MSRMNNNSISSIGMKRLLRPREADSPLHRKSEGGRAVTFVTGPAREEERLRDGSDEGDRERRQSWRDCAMVSVARGQPRKMIHV